MSCEEKQEQLHTERLWSLDITRIVAILAVVMIHVSARFVLDYPTATKEFFIGNIFDSVSRIGVPLFMMTSGALMLDERKNVTFSRLIKKNIKNILILLVFWSAVYCGIYQIWKPWRNGTPLDPEKIIWAFFNGHEHMWYLYSAIGLYIMTPFLRLIVRKENQKMVLLYLGISLLVLFGQPLIRELSRFWEGFDYVRKWLNKFELQFFCGNTSFYLAGWYIVHAGLSQKEKNRLYAAGAVCILVTILYVQFTKDVENGYSRTNAVNFLFAVSVFCGINDLAGRLAPVKNGVVQKLSQLSFGIYIIHIVILDQFRKLMPYGGSRPLAYILGLFCAVFTASLAASFLLSKIPLLKKTVRM